MAEWVEEYRQGSFRGVEFKTKSHELREGRRKVDHEFPSKEEGNSEDIGKRLFRDALDIYVIGDDYFAQRDALREALNTEGPGELIHPYLGTLQVQVGGYSMSETTDEGRMARFNVEFTEAGEPKFPAEATDAQQSVLNASGSALDASKNAFEEAFGVLGEAARVAEDAAALVSDAADSIQEVTDKVGEGAQAIADVAFAIRNIKADAEALVRTPGLLVDRFHDAFALLFDAVVEPKDLSLALSGTTSNFQGDPVIGGDTPTVNTLRGNQLAIENMIVEASVSSSATAAIQGNYVSVDESVDVLALLNRDLDSQLDKISDDNLFQNIRDLKVAINRGLPPQDVGDLIQFTPKKSLPVVVISHKLFGNIEKEQEIIEQNKIRHPGFAEGGTELEVSSG